MQTDRKGVDKLIYCSEDTQSEGRQNGRNRGIAYCGGQGRYHGVVSASRPGARLGPSRIKRVNRVIASRLLLRGMRFQVRYSPQCLQRVPRKGILWTSSKIRRPLTCHAKSRGSASLFNDFGPIHL